MHGRTNNINGTSDGVNGTTEKNDGANHPLGTNSSTRLVDKLVFLNRTNITNGNGTNNTFATTSLPSSSSPALHLTHPTPCERYQTWERSSAEWGKSLPTPTYIEREDSLCTASALARAGGITHWVLVDRTLLANARPVLATAESLRKRTLVATPGGGVKEVISHGIGSVFCYPEFRGKGYASRMMRELGEKLRNWQIDESRDVKDVAFSMLYSDIGREFYASHGWKPFPSAHIEFPTTLSTTEQAEEGLPVKVLKTEDLAQLCERDEALLRVFVERPSQNARVRVVIPPDADHFEWHRAREEFVTQRLFGRIPDLRGALVGEEGSRVWAVWARVYYGRKDEAEKNTLYILRLAVEEEMIGSSVVMEGKLAKQLSTVMAVAREEGEKWGCGRVEVWNPSELVRGALEMIGGKGVEREKEGIPCAMWYGAEGDEVEWIANEKYAWC